MQRSRNIRNPPRRRISKTNTPNKKDQVNLETQLSLLDISEKYREFTLFPELPVELQLKTWDAAVLKDRRRLGGMRDYGHNGKT